MNYAKTTRHGRSLGAIVPINALLMLGSLMVRPPALAGAADLRPAGTTADRPSRPAANGTTKRVTLRATLDIARKNNRTLRVARARIGEARGDLTQASILLVSNPALGLGIGPRFATASDERATVDFDVSLEQSLELGGQRRHRRTRARANLHAARASTADVRRVVNLAVTLLYYRTLAARERVRLTRENVALAQALLDTARQRVTLGAGSQLDLNTSRLRLAEARRKALGAAAALQALRLRLAKVCGLVAGTGLRLQGALPGPRPLPDRAALVRRAIRRRPDFLALRHRIEAVGAGVRLARAGAWPDLTLGVRYAREENRNAVLLSLKIRLPFFDRNQETSEHARARLGGLRAQRSGVRLSIITEVRLAWVGHQRAAQALRLYSGAVLAAQRQSARLLRRSFRKGQVSLAQVLVVQRELVTGRAGHLTARLRYAESLARLRAAASLPQATTHTRRKKP